ncbi:MAG: aminotransferase class V-fold PLP-dependent enzyme [Pseudomonadota bacterium]
MIYLNAAAHGLPDAAVRARMRAHLELEDQIGPIAAECEAGEEMAAVTAKAARVIDAPAENVTLMPTTTLGWNAAVMSLPLAGKRVMVAPGEWSSDVAVLQRMGARIEPIPTDNAGALDVKALAANLDDDVAAICLPMVCSLTGDLYPAAQIGALPRPDTCAFVVDAAQAVGQMPVSVRALNCDILAATTRKWVRGPRDTGLLYVSDTALERMEANPAPRLYNIVADGNALNDRPGIRRFGSDSGFAPQRLGQGVALDQFLDGAEQIFALLNQLTIHASDTAAKHGLPLANREPSGSAIITLQLPRAEADAGMARIRDAGIDMKDAGPDCEPLRAIDADAEAFLRISPHVYNTEAEIDCFFDALTAD